RSRRTLPRRGVPRRHRPELFRRDQLPPSRRRRTPAAAQRTAARHRAGHPAAGPADASRTRRRNAGVLPACAGRGAPLPDRASLHARTDVQARGQRPRAAHRAPPPPHGGADRPENIEGRQAQADAAPEPAPVAERTRPESHAAEASPAGAADQWWWGRAERSSETRPTQPEQRLDLARPSARGPPRAPGGAQPPAAVISASISAGV